MSIAVVGAVQVGINSSLLPRKPRSWYHVFFNDLCKLFLGIPEAGPFLFYFLVKIVLIILRLTNCFDN